MAKIIVLHRRILNITAAALVLVLLGTACLEARAQRTAQPVEASAEEHDEWYYSPKPVEVPEKTIAQQKAERRAQQRMDRLAAQRWYGVTPGRPSVTGIPFTGSYGQVWVRSGDRPYVWYTAQEPTVVVLPRYRYW